MLPRYSQSRGWGSRGSPCSTESHRWRGEEDQRVSDVLMFKRVAWQAAAVLFVLLALLANLH